MHSSHENDGTIAITTQVKQPMQGTLICEDETKALIVAKGVIRPPLQDVYGQTEDESFVEDVAFGKSLSPNLTGEIFAIREVGKERCRLAYQTILFGTKHPARIIEADNKRINSLSALDLLSSSARKKVTAGVPISLLVQDMAPWDMLRRFEVPGVRATVYGSELVPRGDIEDELESVVGQALTNVGLKTSAEWTGSKFMVLPDTAESLSKQLNVSIDHLNGTWFLVHRDPALPDGTSLFPAMFAGVLHWRGGKESGHGVVLNPQDPNWESSGGDFDGDACALYVPSKDLLPRDRVQRLDYKINAHVYTTSTVAEQIIEACADTTTELLGPVILNAMRLAERMVDDKALRVLAASAAQAAVQAKKHAVDIDATQSSADIIAAATRDATEGGLKPYLSSLMNELRRASGIEEKRRLWIALVDFVNVMKPVYTSSIEIAMIDRINAIDVLFQDTKFFQSLDRVSIPSTIRTAAAALAPLDVADAVAELTEEYHVYTRKIPDIEEIEEDELRTEYERMIRNDLALIKAKFHLAIATGTFPGLTSTPKEAQAAVIAFGPARVAAQMCPPEIFLALGKRSKRIITALSGHNWKNGVISVDELNPIPNCAHDVELFKRDIMECDLQIIKNAAHSTRVCLSSM